MPDNSINPGALPQNGSKDGTLDLTTPENRKLASDALPALVVGGMLGNAKAAEAGTEIIFGLLAEAMKPSIEAMNRLNTIRRKDQS